MSALNWEECPVVESVPGKVSGAWVLKGDAHAGLRDLPESGGGSQH